MTFLTVYISWFHICYVPSRAETLSLLEDSSSHFRTPPPLIPPTTQKKRRKKKDTSFQVMTTPIISATNVYIAQALFPAASTKSATARRATHMPSPEQRCRAISGDSVQCRREKVPNTDTPWEGRQSRFSRLMEQLCKQHKVKAQGFLVSSGYPTPYTIMT